MVPALSRLYTGTNLIRNIGMSLPNNDAESASLKLSAALRTGSFKEVYALLPHIPGNLIDNNIMSILNCCYQSSDLMAFLDYLEQSKFYLSSYTYECAIVTAGRIGDVKSISLLYSKAAKKYGRTCLLRDSLLHAYRVCDAHQRLISMTYQLFTDHVNITSSQYEDILRTLAKHKEYDSLSEHIIQKMKEESKMISLPVLNILLNMLDVRSPRLTILFIEQTYFLNSNLPLLNIILSREMTKFSEGKSYDGMIQVYKEMSKRKIPVTSSELSRLKRVVGELMASNYHFDISDDDDAFTHIWSRCWLEQKVQSEDDIGSFAEIIKHSRRNQGVELFELLEIVGIECKK